MQKTDKEILQEIADMIPKVRAMDFRKRGISNEEDALSRIINILKEEGFL